MYCVGESMVTISPADSDLRVVVQLLSIRLHIVKLVIAALDFIVTFGKEVIVEMVGTVEQDEVGRGRGMERIVKFIEYAKGESHSISKMIPAMRPPAFWYFTFTTRIWKRAVRQIRKRKPAFVYIRGILSGALKFHGIRVR